VIGSGASSRVTLGRTRIVLFGLLMCGALVTPQVSQALAQQRTTNDGVFTAEQAMRGQVLYDQICAKCHGPTLMGMEAAPPLVGTTFGATWNETPLGDLSERIRLSMPQDKPGSLGRQQTADLLAYILTVNKAPAGKTELPGTAEVLSAIKIVAPQ
jgi:mono/diheme cytochrome c family protein